MTRVDLNDAQRHAAATLSGPVLITAGAGAGKTRTLTERFVNAVVPERVSGWTAIGISQAVAITFTDKAAGELSERVRCALREVGRVEESRAVDGAWISTIHGMCARILRRHALDVGIAPGFTVAEGIVSARLKQRAFDAAANAAIETTGSGERLFGLYGFRGAFSGAERIRREIAARGVKPVVAHPAPDAQAMRHDALQYFGQARHEFATCGIDASTVHKYRDACEGIEELLLGLGEGMDNGTEVAEAIWAAAAANRAIKTTKKEIAAACEEFHRVREELLSEAAASALHPLAQSLIELANDYGARYSALKAEAGLLDFDDLQIRTLSLLELRPEVRERYRSEMQMFMVDEFQDTDSLQLDIVHTLAGENLCTVGDERQSIYGFRGADIDVFREHVNQMRVAGAASFDLVVNYRSHPAILRFANSVFGAEALFGEDLLSLEHGREEPAEPLLPDGEPRVRVEILHAPGRHTNADAAREARILASRFAELRDVHGVRPSDMVVLVRQYSHAVFIASALRAKGFPVLTVGGSRFFGLKETVWLRAFCRVLANPRQDDALIQVLTSPLVDVTDDALYRARSSAREAGSASLWDGVMRLASSADARAEGCLRDAAELISTARARTGSQRLSEVILRAVEEAEVDLKLLAAGDEGREMYANVLKFARMADEYESSEGSGPAGFSAHLDARERYGEHESPMTLADDDSPAVRIMSIHAAKGLEFPVVAVPRLGESRHGDSAAVRVLAADGELKVALRVPRDWRARVKAAGGSEPKDEAETAAFRDLGNAAASNETDESKRLFYVACTRARDALMLFGTANHEKEASSDGPLTWLYSALPGLRGVAVGGEATAIGNSAGPIACVRVTPAEDVPEFGSPESELATPEPVMLASRISSPALAEEAQDAGRRPRWLSYSQIAKYEECPRRFWATHILGIGEPYLPEDDDPRAFGSAVHAALQLASDEIPEEERLAAIARSYGLDGSATAHLREVANNYAASSVAGRLCAHQSIRREVPFAVPVDGDGRLLLVGSMDAYGRTDDTALVIDYKTGVTGDPAELRDRYVSQARSYALAALSDGCTQIEVVFVRPEVLDTVGCPQEIAFRFDESAAAEIKVWIGGVADAIERQEFTALRSWDDAKCSRCPAARIACDLSPEQGAAG